MIIEIFHSTGKIITRLNYHETEAASSCVFDTADSENVIQYISKGGGESLVELVDLYLNRIGTISAPTGWYSDGQYRRYWDASRTTFTTTSLCGAIGQTNIFLIGPFDEFDTGTNEIQEATPEEYTIDIGPRLNFATSIYTKDFETPGVGYYADIAFAQTESTATDTTYTYLKHNVRTDITFDLKFELDSADLAEAGDVWVDDWYLPSADELFELIQNRGHLPAGAELAGLKWYWSSSIQIYEGDISTTSAKCIRVKDWDVQPTGGCGRHNRYNNMYSRAIRTATNYPEGKSVGDIYGGGMIFYLDPIDEICLIVALEDLEANAFGCSGLLIESAIRTAIGTGYQNTLDIITLGCLINDGGYDDNGTWVENDGSISAAAAAVNYGSSKHSIIRNIEDNNLILLGVESKIQENSIDWDYNQFSKIISGEVDDLYSKEDGIVDYEGFVGYSIDANYESEDAFSGDLKYYIGIPGQSYFIDEYSKTAYVRYWDGTTLGGVIGVTGQQILGSSYLKSKELADTGDSTILAALKDLYTSHYTRDSEYYMTDVNNDTTFDLDNATNIYGDFWGANYIEGPLLLIQGEKWRVWQGPGSGTGTGFATILQDDESIELSIDTIVNNISETSAENGSEILYGDTNFNCTSESSINTYYIDNESFNSATNLYTKYYGGSNPAAEYYRHSVIGSPIRDWNGTSFEDNIYACTEVHQLDIKYYTEADGLSDCEHCSDNNVKTPGTFNVDNAIFSDITKIYVSKESAVYGEPGSEYAESLWVIDGDLIKYWDAEAKSFDHASQITCNFDVHQLILKTSESYDTTLCDGGYSAIYVNKHSEAFADYNLDPGSPLYAKADGCERLDVDNDFFFKYGSTVYQYSSIDKEITDYNSTLECNILGEPFSGIKFSTDSYTLCDATSFNAAEYVSIFGDGATFLESTNLYVDTHRITAADEGYYYLDGDHYEYSHDGGLINVAIECVDRTSITLKHETNLGYLCNSTKEIIVWIGSTASWSDPTLVLYTSKYGPGTADSTYFDNLGVTLPALTTGTHYENDLVVDKSVLLLDIETNYFRVFHVTSELFNNDYDLDFNATGSVISVPFATRFAKDWTIGQGSNIITITQHVSGNHPQQGKITFLDHLFNYTSIEQNTDNTDWIDVTLVDDDAISFASSIPSGVVNTGTNVTIDLYVTLINRCETHMNPISFYYDAGANTISNGGDTCKFLYMGENEIDGYTETILYGEDSDFQTILNSSEIYIETQGEAIPQINLNKFTDNIYGDVINYYGSFLNYDDSSYNLIQLFDEGTKFNLITDYDCSDIALTATTLSYSNINVNDLCQNGVESTYYISDDVVLSNPSIVIYNDPYMAEKSAVGYYKNEDGYNVYFDGNTTGDTLQLTCTELSGFYTSINLYSAIGEEEICETDNFAEYWINEPLFIDATEIYSNQYASSLHTTSQDLLDIVNNKIRQWKYFPADTVDDSGTFAGSVTECTAATEIDLIFSESLSTQGACDGESTPSYYIGSINTHAGGSQSISEGFKLYTTGLADVFAATGTYSNGTIFIQWDYDNGTVTMWGNCSVLTPIQLLFANGENAANEICIQTTTTGYWIDDDSFYDATVIYTSELGSPGLGSDLQGIAETGLYKEPDAAIYREFIGVDDITAEVLVNSSEQPIGIPFDGWIYGIVCDVMTPITLAYNATSSESDSTGAGLCVNSTGYTEIDAWIDTATFESATTAYYAENKIGGTLPSTHYTDGIYVRKLNAAVFDAPSSFTYGCKQAVELKYLDITDTFDSDDYGDSLYNFIHNNNTAFVIHYMFGETFETAEGLYTNTENTQAPSGYYTDGNTWRIYDNSSGTFVVFEPSVINNNGYYNHNVLVPTNILTQHIDITDDNTALCSADPTQYYFKYDYATLSTVLATPVTTDGEYVTTSGANMTVAGDITAWPPAGIFNIGAESFVYSAISGQVLTFVSCTDNNQKIHDNAHGISIIGFDTPTRISTSVIYGYVPATPDLFYSIEGEDAIMKYEDYYAIHTNVNSIPNITFNNICGVAMNSVTLKSIDSTETSYTSGICGVTLADTTFYIDTDNFEDATVIYNSSGEWGNQIHLVPVPSGWKHILGSNLIRIWGGASFKPTIFDGSCTEINPVEVYISDQGVSTTDYENMCGTLDDAFVTKYVNGNNIIDSTIIYDDIYGESPITEQSIGVFQRFEYGGTTFLNKRRMFNEDGSGLFTTGSVDCIIYESTMLNTSSEYVNICDYHKSTYDWYLPSKYELIEIYDVLVGLNTGGYAGTFNTSPNSSGAYWSSTRSTHAYYATAVYFGTQPISGSIIGGNATNWRQKTNVCHVRPIRTANEYHASLILGDVHEGGIIFYLDTTNEICLIAAMEDLDQTYEWGCTSIAGQLADYSYAAEGTVIGTGYRNTHEIVAGNYCATSDGSTSAAQATLDVVVHPILYNEEFFTIEGESFDTYTKLYSTQYGAPLYTDAFIVDVNSNMIRAYSTTEFFDNTLVSSVEGDANYKRCILYPISTNLYRTEYDGACASFNINESEIVDISSFANTEVVYSTKVIGRIYNGTSLLNENTYVSELEMSKFSSNQYEYSNTIGTYYSDYDGLYKLTLNSYDNQTISKCSELPIITEDIAVINEYSYDEYITGNQLAAISFCNYYDDNSVLEYTSNTLFNQVTDGQQLFLDPYGYYNAPEGFYGILLNVNSPNIATYSVDSYGNYTEIYSSCGVFTNSYSNTTLYYSDSSALKSCAAAAAESVSVQVTAYYDYNIEIEQLMLGLSNDNFNFDVFTDIMEQTLLAPGWYSNSLGDVMEVTLGGLAYIQYVIEIVLVDDTVSTVTSLATENISINNNTITIDDDYVIEATVAGGIVTDITSSSNTIEYQPTPINEYYSIGEFAEGGIIFQINEDGSGLVAALEDLDQTYEFGCYNQNASGSADSSIGGGYQNTLDIIAANCQPNSGGLTAAQATLAYESEGYSDWYLPSKNELMEIHDTIGQGSNIGGFANDFYWSSTEGNFFYAGGVNFDNSNFESQRKNEHHLVRAIRSFETPIITTPSFNIEFEYFDDTSVTYTMSDECSSILSSTISIVDDTSVDPCTEDDENLLEALEVHTIKEYPFLNISGGDIFTDVLLEDAISLEQIFKTKFCTITNSIATLCGGNTITKTSDSIIDHTFVDVAAGTEFALDNISLKEATSIATKTSDGEWEQATESHYSDGYAFKKFESDSDVFDSEYIQEGTAQLIYEAEFDAESFVRLDPAVTYTNYAYDGIEIGTSVDLTNATSIYVHNTVDDKWEQHTDIGFYSDANIVRYMGAVGLSTALKRNSIELAISTTTSVCASTDNTASTYYIDNIGGNSFSTIAKIYELDEANELVLAVSGQYIYNDNGTFKYRSVVDGELTTSSVTCSSYATIQLSKQKQDRLYPQYIPFPKSTFFMDSDTPDFYFPELKLYKNTSGALAGTGYYIFNDSHYRFWDKDTKIASLAVPIGRFPISISTSSTANAACLYTSAQPYYINNHGTISQGNIIYDTGQNRPFPGSPRSTYSNGQFSFAIHGSGAVNSIQECTGPPPGAPAVTNSAGFELAYDGNDFPTATVGMSNYDYYPIAPAGFYTDGQIVRYWSGKSQKLSNRSYTWRKGTYAKLRYSRKDNACISRPAAYYLNHKTFIIASEIYKDAFLIIPAETGYYSDGTIIRRWDKTTRTFDGFGKVCYIPPPPSLT